MTLRVIEGALVDADGRRHSPLSTPDSWPGYGEVLIRDGHLVAGGGGGPGGPKTGMLEEFVALANPDIADEQIRTYAQKWGLLGLCAHGEPYQHWGEFESCLEVVEQVEPHPEGNRFDIESLEAWRRHALDVRRVLERLADDPWMSRVDDLASKIDGRLAAAAVRPSLVRLRGAPRIEIGSGTLFGALWLAVLYAAVGGGAGNAFCPGCGEWFARSPNQHPRRAAWCPKPGCQRAKRARASRAYRERNRTDPMRILAARGPWAERTAKPGQP